jgi:hypothetical protein
VKAFLDTRGVDATVSVVTEWPLEHERDVRGGGQVYLSWDDLNALRDEGWTITAHGRSGLLLEGVPAAATNYEVNGSLTDLVNRGFGSAWSLYSYKSSAADPLAQRLVHESYAYGRINTSDIWVMDLPLAQPQQARAFNTWGGHCNDPSLKCFDLAPKPYRLPSEVISAVNGMGPDQWTLLQSYRFVEGTQLSGTVQFDCTGPPTQHWTRVGTGGRETYCWNDYQSIIDGVATQFATPDAVAALYGRAIFPGVGGRAGSTPEALAFGVLDPGEASPSKPITFLNTGTAPLSISGTSLTGANPGDFALQSDGCTGQELPGGGACSVSVGFTPSASGGRSAELSFAHTAAGSPLKVPLTGTGASPASVGHVLRPNADLVSGWRPVGSSTAWSALDDPIEQPTPASATDYIKARKPPATWVTEVGLSSPALGAGAPVEATAWFHARTNTGTRLQVDVRWGGSTRETYVVAPRISDRWHQVPISPTPPDQAALDDVSLRFTALDGYATYVRAAYLELHTDG